jgi:uncharacterized membrane protein
MKRLLCGWMVLGLFLGMAGPGKGQPTYAFTALDVPGAYSLYSACAAGINDSGQIVGSYDDIDSSQGFLLDNSGSTSLHLPGDTYATGINASGQIVGWYFDGTTGHGFLLDQGSYNTLDVPGAGYGYYFGTQAYGINDSG